MVKFNLSVPCCVKCYLFPHPSFLSCIHLSSRLCIYSLFFILPFSVPVFFKLSPSLHPSLSLSLSPCSLCLYWFCGSARSMLLALFLMEGVRWSLGLPNEIKLKTFPSLSLFPRNRRKPHRLWTCMCEMSSLCSDCQPISAPPSPWFSAPHPSLFSPPKVYFCLTLSTCVTATNEHHSHGLPHKYAHFLHCTSSLQIFSFCARFQSTSLEEY